MSPWQPVDAAPLEVLDRLRRWLSTASEPLVMTTSGSTGEPKQVLLSSAAVSASARASLERLGGPGQWLLALPVTAIGGLQVLTRSVLADQPPVVLDGRQGFSSGVETMQGARRYTALVPTQLHRLLAGPDAPTQVPALRSFDAVLVGGAAAAPKLLQRAADFGVAVVTTYGSTETCGGCVYDGVPLDGVSVALAPDGRVRVSGPVLFSGYLDQPDRTGAVLAGGWLTTNDLGRWGSNGRLEVLGRVDDVVVSGGVKVATSAVAERLRQHPAIRAAAVAGVDDPEWGSRVVAYVVAVSPLPSTAQLRDFVAERLPRSWAPREVVVVPELPTGGRPSR